MDPKSFSNLRKFLQKCIEQDSFCGYPNFEITCKNNSPVLTISDDNYIIKDISYSNNTFVVVNAVVYEEMCPIPLQNATFDRTPFSLSSDNVYFSFLYNCTERPDYHTYPVRCASNTSSYSFAVFHEEGLESSNYSLESCQSFVNAPVYMDTDTYSNFTSLLKANYSEVLRMGFLLNWTAHSCSNCESSGGHCGFDNDHFICFCQDRSHSKTCNDAKPNWRVKVGIGIGCGVGGILIASAVFFLYQHRKKALNYARSRSFSQDNSLPPQTDSEMGVFLWVQHFSYNELEKATNKFDSARELGDGGFGIVYYGKLQDGRPVAVKRLYENNENNENNYKRVKQFWNEIEILGHLRHPNLVSLYGYTSHHSRELLLVYEYISNGTVADHLHGEGAKPGSLSWSIRLKIAIETASALTYLHACDVIHRDVKTDNILLDENFCVKVADFGICHLFPLNVEHVSTSPHGTPGYIDPEYNECHQLSDKSDVFSFGVVLIELISSKPAVDITRHGHVINLSNTAIGKIQNLALHELVDPSLGFESDCNIRTMITSVAAVAFQCLQGGKDMRPTMGKSGPQTLPLDSVTVKWISNSSTSNASI
ncbi:hypothetical protein SLE2022_345530 [Rubroshorea leprosula]